MTPNRRTLVAGGIALVGATTIAGAQPKPQVGDGSMGARTDMNIPELKSAKQYYEAVLGPAEISLATSLVASQMAVTRDAHEFAGFELSEAITVNMVLKNLGAKYPEMDANGKAAVEKVKAAAASKTAALDRVYIAFQLANHEHLRNLAETYLHETIGASDPADIQGRSLAALMLAVFKEHTLICKRISTEVKSL